MGDGEPSPGSSCPPWLPPQLPTEFPNLPKRQRRCCGQGTWMALLGLVTVMLWAGLLMLLLFWREDTPSPMQPLPCLPSQNPTSRRWDLTPLRVQCPHQGASCLVPSPLSPFCPPLRAPRPGQRLCLPPFLPLLSGVYPRPPSPPGRWGTRGQGHLKTRLLPSSCLPPPRLGRCTEAETARTNHCPERYRGRGRGRAGRGVLSCFCPLAPVGRERKTGLQYPPLGSGGQPESPLPLG